LIASFVLLQVGNGGLIDMIRYWVPTIVGLQVAVGWWLGHGLEDASPRLATVSLTAFVVIVAIGFLDDRIRSQERIWWTNAYGAPFAGVVRAIDSSSPGTTRLVLGNAKDFEALEDLASLLEPSDLVWIPNGRPIPASRSRRAVYAFTRFPAMARATAENAPATPIAVSYPPRGYGLITSARTSREPTTVWLWKLQ
jgi:hypothetical protein